MTVRKPDLRVAAFSDIHGNIHGLHAVLDAIDSTGGADVLICAGDLLGGSGGHQDVIDLLLEREVVLVRGNHDEDGRDLEATLAVIPEAHRPWARETHAWLTEHLEPQSLDLLADLPLSHVVRADDKHSLYACHAAPNDNRVWANGPDVDAERLHDLFCALAHELIVFGHYHQHNVQLIGGKTLVNVASVGLRYDGRAAFSIIDFIGGRWMIAQHLADYDVHAELRLMRERRAPEPRFDLLPFPPTFGWERRVRT